MSSNTSNRTPHRQLPQDKTQKTVAENMFRFSNSGQQCTGLRPSFAGSQKWNGFNLGSEQKQPSDETRKMIQEIYARGYDDEITTTTLRVSLICPLTTVRITVPARGSTCRHLQCFDRAAFLQMNAKSSTWKCPICNGAVGPYNLKTDCLFREILAQCPTANEIQFFEDGRWKSVDSLKTNHTIAMFDATEEIDLTGTDDEDNDDGDVGVVWSCNSIGVYL